MEDQDTLADRRLAVGRWGVIGLLKHFTAGGAGGVLNVLAGHPLDTIKVACTIYSRVECFCIMQESVCVTQESVCVM